jgi:hypothetical protein
MTAPLDPDQVIQILGPIADRAETQGLEALSGPEQNVLLVWWGKGYVDNGGFEWFYEGASNALQVADAYEALGLTDAADAWRKSVEVFPDGKPPEDLQDRRDWMCDHEEEVRAFFDPLSRIIWDVDDRLNERLGEYIPAHAAHFRDLRGSWAH